MTLASVSPDADDVINAPQHSLGQDYSNKVQHNFIGHVTPLVSCDASTGVTSCQQYCQ